MVKVWKSVDEFASTQLPSELKEYRKTMQSVPRFGDRSQGARMIYKKGHFFVYKVDEGFIVHNTNKTFKNGHTHIKSFNVAKTIIDVALTRKMPKTRSHYLLRSIIRISTDINYIDKIEKLIQVREDKQKLNYKIK